MIVKVTTPHKGDIFVDRIAEVQVKTDHYSVDVNHHSENARDWTIYSTRELERLDGNRDEAAQLDLAGSAVRFFLDPQIGQSGLRKVDRIDAYLLDQDEDNGRPRARKVLEGAAKREIATDCRAFLLSETGETIDRLV